VIAITIPASTNTTIATCIQSQWRGIRVKRSNGSAGPTGEDAANATVRSTASRALQPS
jgi:hypothetical protein